MSEEIKVGSTIWRFDENYRVYEPGTHGFPIYREHWRTIAITGETSRSWNTHYGKCPKKGDHPGFAFSLAEVDDDCWLKAHRASIANAVHRCYDASKLRAIADILGWEERRAT